MWPFKKKKLLPRLLKEVNNILEEASKEKIYTNDNKENQLICEKIPSLLGRTLGETINGNLRMSNFTPDEKSGDFVSYIFNFAIDENHWSGDINLSFRVKGSKLSMIYPKRTPDKLKTKDNYIMNKYRSDKFKTKENIKKISDVIDDILNEFNKEKSKNFVN